MHYGCSLCSRTPHRVTSVLRSRIRALLSAHPEADSPVFPELFVTGSQVGYLRELSLTTGRAPVSAIWMICFDIEIVEVASSLAIKRLDLIIAAAPNMEPH